MSSPGQQREPAGFHVVPFAPDGEPVGRGFWELAKLSPRWLHHAGTLLEAGGRFDGELPGSLSHLRIKCTTACGAALLTITVRGVPAMSSVLLTGEQPMAETDVLKMFVGSLRGVRQVQSYKSVQPFEAALHVKERPVMMLVVWGRPEISSQDADLVREFGIHFGGAFFTRGTS